MKYQILFFQVKPEKCYQCYLLNSPREWETLMNSIYLMQKRSVTQEHEYISKNTVFQVIFTELLYLLLHDRSFLYQVITGLFSVYL